LEAHPRGIEESRRRAIFEAEEKLTAEFCLNDGERNGIASPGP
jgi:hypothetical protein